MFGVGRGGGVGVGGRRIGLGSHKCKIRLSVFNSVLVQYKSW